MLLIKSIQCKLQAAEQYFYLNKQRSFELRRLLFDYLVLLPSNSESSQAESNEAGLQMLQILQTCGFTVEEAP